MEDVKNKIISEINYLIDNFNNVEYEDMRDRRQTLVHVIVFFAEELDYCEAEINAKFAEFESKYQDLINDEE